MPVFRRTAKRRGCLTTLLTLALLALVLRLFSAQLLTAGANLLIEDDGPHKADAIVVLGGDNYGDRTLKGAELGKAGYAPYVVISGPGHLVGTDADIEVQYAEQHGFPDALFHKIALPPDAESTRTEARYVGKILRDSGVRSVLLVTSNYHTRRAARLWRTENPGITVSAVGSVDPYGFFTASTWWKTRPGQKTFLFEWMKTVSVMLGN